MSKTKVFISYSRADTEYVSHLVDALRERGFDTWFDANIRTGNEWDNAIEREIKAAQVMVLILSESSVASDNVKDEMSYALQLNKFVNPIKIGECDIPMRLARRQFIDFDAIGFEEGLNRLIEDMQHQVAESSTIKPDTTVAAAMVEKITKKPKPVAPVVPKKAAEPPKAPIASNQTTPPAPVSKPPPKKNKHLLYYIAGGIAILLLGAFVIPKLVPDKDKEAFDAALLQDSKSGYESYLTTNSQGKFALQARDSVESKIAQERAAASVKLIQKEDLEWKNAVKEGDKVAYQIYVRAYPEGRYVSKAIDSIKKREQDATNIAADNVAWNIAKNKNTVSDYLGYLIDPDIIGLHRTEAQSKILEKSTEGYLYYGRISGDKISGSRVFDVICCGDTAIAADQIPKKGDILLSTDTRYTYKDVNTNYKTGKQVRKGNRAMVTDVHRPSDNSIVVKVRF